MPEKGPDHGAPALNKDGANPAFRQVIKEATEVHFLVAESQHLRMRERPLACIGGHDQRGRTAVEDMGSRRGLALGIEDDSERVPTPRVLRFDRELWIVGQNGPDADEDRIHFGPESMHPAGILLVAQTNRATTWKRDLPVHAHRGVDDHTGSHTAAKGRSE